MTTDISKLFEELSSQAETLEPFNVIPVWNLYHASSPDSSEGLHELPEVLILFKLNPSFNDNISYVVTPS